MLGSLARRLAIGVTVGVFLWLLAPQAHAQKAIADALFKEGIELAKQGQLAKACPKFRASYDLDPQVGSLESLAACHVEIGKTASAWTEYNELASLARREGKQEAADRAQKASAELRPKLSYLKLTLEAPVSNMTVSLDGEVVPRAALTASLPVDPGPHELRAEAAKHEEWSKQITIPQAPTTTGVTIPPLVPRKDGGGAPVIIDKGLNDNEVIGYTLGAVGLAGVLLGTVMGIVATVETNNANDNCINRFCTQEGLDGHDRALAFAHISTISLAVGGAAVATGLVLILTAPDPTAAPPAADAPPASAANTGAWMLHLRGTW